MTRRTRPLTVSRRVQRGIVWFTTRSRGRREAPSPRAFRGYLAVISLGRRSRIHLWFPVDRAVDRPRQLRRAIVARTRWMRLPLAERRQAAARIR